jgi:hypothetical protein
MTQFGLSNISNELLSDITIYRKPSSSTLMLFNDDSISATDQLCGRELSPVAITR